MKYPSKLGLISMAFALAGMGMHNPHDNPFPESKEELEERLKRAEIERYKRQGLKQFLYKTFKGYESVWALNQKSADKKARKKGYII